MALPEREAWGAAPEARTLHGGGGVGESHGPGSQGTEAGPPLVHQGHRWASRTAQAPQSVPRCNKSLSSKPLHLRRPFWGVGCRGLHHVSGGICCRDSLAEPGRLQLGLLSVLRKPTNQPAFVASFSFQNLPMWLEP